MKQIRFTRVRRTSAVPAGTLTPTGRHLPPSVTPTPAGTHILTRTRTPAGTLSVSVTLTGTLTLTACDPAGDNIHHTIQGIASDPASNPGSAWPWMLLTLAVLVAAGLVLAWFVNMSTRRRNWPALAMSAYGQGTLLVTALKSGGQTQADFDIGADGYATRLNQLQRDAPYEEARWVIARVSTALNDVRGAVADHPGTQTVRATVRILEETLEELHTAAYDANPPIE